MKTKQDTNPDDDPHDDNPTLTHPWVHWLQGLRAWAAKKAARYGHDAKRQFIRGASYSLGSGAVGIVILVFKHWL